MNDGMLSRTTMASGGGECKAFTNLERLGAGCDGRMGMTGACWCDGHAKMRRKGATMRQKCDIKCDERHLGQNVVKCWTHVLINIYMKACTHILNVNMRGY